jgi:hypothetical protein
MMRDRASAILDGAVVLAPPPELSDASVEGVLGLLLDAPSRRLKDCETAEIVMGGGTPPPSSCAESSVDGGAMATTAPRHYFIFSLRSARGAERAAIADAALAALLRAATEVRLSSIFLRLIGFLSGGCFF